MMVEIRVIHAESRATYGSPLRSRRASGIGSAGGAQRIARLMHASAIAFPPWHVTDYQPAKRLQIRDLYPRNSSKVLTIIGKDLCESLLSHIEAMVGIHESIFSWT